MSAYEALKAQLTFADDPQWPTRDKVEKWLIAVESVVGATRQAYQLCRGNAEQQADLADAIERVHDEFIAPLDIPGVGNLVEGMVDRNLGAILGGAVKQVDSKLDKILPNPVPSEEPAAPIKQR